MNRQELQDFVLKQKCIPWRILHWLAIHAPWAYSILIKGTVNPNTKALWDNAWQDQKYKKEYMEHMRDVFNAVAALVPEKSKVLDVGCGAGDVLFKLKQNKECDVFGIDLSENAVRQVREKGIPADTCTLPNIPFKAESFDVVIATEILEHLNRPKETLRAIHRVLKSGGMLIASVPDNSLAPDDEYAHVSCFTRQSLYKLLSIYFNDVNIISVSAVWHGALVAAGTKKGKANV